MFEGPTPQGGAPAQGPAAGKDDTDQPAGRSIRRPRPPRPPKPRARHNAGNFPV